MRGRAAVAGTPQRTVAGLKTYGDAGSQRIAFPSRKGGIHSPLLLSLATSKDGSASMEACLQEQSEA